MKTSPWHVSLLALTLFAVAAPAQAGTAPAGGMIVAQATDQPAAGNQDFGQVRKFLAHGRNVSKLEIGQLQQRLNRAQRFKQISGLPADLSAQLDQEIASLNAEIANRQQAGSSAGTAAQGNVQPGQGSTDQTDQAAGSQSKKAGGAGNAGAGNAEVDQFIQSAQPVSGLEVKALRQQLRKAMQLMKSSGITAEQRRQLREIITTSRAEMQQRKGGGGTAQQGAAGTADQGGTAGTGGGQAGAGTGAGAGGGTAAGTAGGSGQVDSFLQSVQPVSGLEVKQLRQQMRRAMQLSKTTGITADQRQQLRKIMLDARAEMQLRKSGKSSAGGGAAGGTAGGGVAGGGAAGGGTVGGGTAGGVTQGTAGTQGGQGLANKPVDQASEQKAQVLLGANVDASKLSKADQRKRLSDMRDLLQSNQLSPQTKKALRQKLASERAILRGEIGGNQADAGSGGDTNVTVNNTTTINQNVVKVVLADRRQAAELRDDELRRRIDVYRVVAFDPSYSDADRRQYRAFLDRDRVVLRDRMLQGKRTRAEKLRNRNDINIDLSLNFRPDRPPPPRSVFAAEVDDSELVDVLSAPPRRQIDRRYTVQEVETNPDLRDAVARIEIDTVHFGFGEGFLREEEIDKLDRIAEVMEKILAKSPGEVFMIEGHTDAVGSPEANLQLSRERAKAVVEALSTYYVIPAENLKPVGYGEKYLKIPTEEPEAENRRVSIARITPLVGELQ